MRYPEKLLELEIARYEASKGKGYVEEVVDLTRQFYDWRVLTALVSGSAAWALLVEGGQQIGKTEQMWAVLDADARILSSRQVRALNTALNELVAEEDEQTLIDLAMAEQADRIAEQANNLLLFQQVLITNSEDATIGDGEWTIGDSELAAHWSKWPKQEPLWAKINLELYWIKQQVQQFVQKVIEAEGVLMIIA